MTYYLQFLVVNQNKYLSDLLGSDGVFILDGRNKLDTMKADAQLRMHRLRFVQPNIIGYKIIKGTRFDDNNPVLYTWILSGTIYNKSEVIEND